MNIKVRRLYLTSKKRERKRKKRKEKGYIIESKRFRFLPKGEAPFLKDA